MQFFLLILRDASLAFVVAVGFAVLFNTPRRVLWVAGVLGGLGHAIRFVMIHYQIGLIPSTLVAATCIGLLGIVFSHRVHTPPIVFTMPACITMIPGLYAYRAMLGCIRITDLEMLKKEPMVATTTAHYFVITASLLFALAIGICSGALLFRKRSPKSIFKRIF
jgi:uncharacterized membrane protein YjjB (DUF3815 family)